MEVMKTYRVKPLSAEKQITAEVPASKSLFNRTAVLAALSKGRVEIDCGELGDDSITLLRCLTDLGVTVSRTETGWAIGGGAFQNATVDVGSAGTAARFLTAALAFCGGEYRILCSEQMKKRPMELLEALSRAGVEIEYLEETGKLPVALRSNGIYADSIEVNTDKSTQFASALLLAACVREKPFTVRMTGRRTDGSYIRMTLDLLTKFCIPYQRTGNAVTVYPQTQAPARYTVEPDVSAACYFYALALLGKKKVLIKGIRPDSVQGDMQFLHILEKKGVVLVSTPDGLLADGSAVDRFTGFDETVTDFSDQTMTLAVAALFGTCPSVLRGVGHIRRQECDRIRAIEENIRALGGRTSFDGENLTVYPAPLHAAAIKTYCDHRIAMSFALAGTLIGGVEIENPDCCRKTFSNFFSILDRICQTE